MLRRDLYHSLVALKIADLDIKTMTAHTVRCLDVIVRRESLIEALIFMILSRTMSNP